MLFNGLFEVICCCFKNASFCFPQPAEYGVEGQVDLRHCPDAGVGRGGLGGDLSLAQRLLINPGQSRSRDGISPVGTGKTEDMFVSPLAACATVGLEGELN